MSVRSPHRRAVLAAFVVLLACLAVVRFGAAPGRAASGWLPAETLPATGPSLEDARVALDARGNALAVWVRRSVDRSVLQASWRPAGAGWQPAVNLSSSRDVLPDPQVAITPRGDAVVVWATFIARRYVAMSVARRAGGAWERPVRVSPGSRAPSTPQLALDPQGTAFAVWEQWARGTTTVRAALRPPGRGWRRPVTLTRFSGPSSADYAAPLVAAGAGGDVVVIWTRASKRRTGGRPRSTTVQAAVRPAGAPWRRPVTISRGGPYVTGGDVAVDAQGNALAALTSASGESVWATSMQVVARPAGERWDSPLRLSVAGEAAAEPQVAFDPRGNATALWSRFPRTGWTIVRSAIRPAGGSWQAPVNVSAPGEQAGGGRLAVDGRGTAYAVWQRSLTFYENLDEYDAVVRAASRPAGGAWQAPVDLSAIGLRVGFVRVAGDPRGGAMAIWEQSADRSTVIQAAAHPG